MEKKLRMDKGLRHPRCLLHDQRGSGWAYEYPGAPGPSLLLMVCKASHRQEVSHNNCASLFHFPVTPTTFHNLSRTTGVLRGVTIYYAYIYLHTSEQQKRRKLLGQNL